MDCDSVLVVRRDCDRAGDFLSDDFPHRTDSSQVGEDVAFALPVEDPLTVNEDLHDSLASRRDSKGYIGSEVTEEFIRHPRGGT